MKKECKRHRWRLGAGIGGIVNKELIEIGKHVYCEKCGKKIKVHLHSEWEMDMLKKGSPNKNA